MLGAPFLSAKGLPSTSGAGGWQASGWLEVVWGWQPTCSFSILWCGEAFHGVGDQGAKVSALPGASPLPSMSPASQQVP
jgi:hypothetical protein